MNEDKLKYCLIRGRELLEYNKFEKKDRYLYLYKNLDFNKLNSIEELYEIFEKYDKNDELCKEVYMKLFMYYKVSSWLEGERDKEISEMFNYLLILLNEEKNREIKLEEAKRGRVNQKRRERYKINKENEKKCIIPDCNTNFNKKIKKGIENDVAKCYNMYKERSEREDIKNISINLDALKEFFDNLEGIRRDDIAEFIGVSPRGFYRKLSGEHPFTVEELLKIIMIFKLSLKDFIK